jgi:hypothetical protein
MLIAPIFQSILDIVMALEYLGVVRIEGGQHRLYVPPEDPHKLSKLILQHREKARKLNLASSSSASSSNHFLVFKPQLLHWTKPPASAIKKKKRKKLP